MPQACGWEALKKADFRRLAPTRADLRRLAPTCADLRRLAPTFADFRRLAPTKKNFFWTTHQNCYALCVQKRRFLSTLMKKIILSLFFHTNGKCRPNNGSRLEIFRRACFLLDFR